MKKHHALFSTLFRTLVCGVLVGFVSACVSVDLGPKQGSKSKKIKFQEPGSPFEDAEIDGMDRAWQSKGTGNTIAFLSECGGSEVSLQQMDQEARSVLSDGKIQKQDRMEFNQRDSLETWSQGSLDGVRVRLVVLVFKKNGCGYTVTYTGSNKSFDQNVANFQEFKKGFVAP